MTDGTFKRLLIRADVEHLCCISNHVRICISCSTLDMLGLQLYHQLRAELEYKLVWNKLHGPFNLNAITCVIVMW